MKQANAPEDESVESGDVQDTELPDLESQALAERIARLTADMKAFEVRVLRVRELVQYTDWFVIASGRSDRQVDAIQSHVQRVLRNDHELRPLSVEGGQTNQWVIVDYGEVLLHVFYEPVREFYQLEQLWFEAPLLALDLPDAGAASSDAGSTSG